MSVKIFGERNTGTNALLQLLKINSESEFHPGTMSELAYYTARKMAVLQSLGLKAEKREKMIDKVFEGRPLLQRWKHSATNVTLDELEAIEDARFIFTVRSPLSWLVGLYKRPYHIQTERSHSLTAFAEGNWIPVKRENLTADFYKPLDLLEEKWKSYVNLMQRLECKGIRYKIVKFEDFVVDQYNVFESLKGFVGVPEASFRELRQSTKEKNKDSKYYATYYANEVWRSEYPEIDRVRNTVSGELCSVFGY